MVLKENEDMEEEEFVFTVLKQHILDVYYNRVVHLLKRKEGKQ